MVRKSSSLKKSNAMSEEERKKQSNKIEVALAIRKEYAPRIRAQAKKVKEAMKDLIRLDKDMQKHTSVVVHDVGDEIMANHASFDIFGGDSLLASEGTSFQDAIDMLKEVMRIASSTSADGSGEEEEEDSSSGSSEEEEDNEDDEDE
jgi:hypothetical protein